MLDDQSFVDLSQQLGLLDRQTLEEVMRHAQRSGRGLFETAVELRAVEEWPLIEAAGSMFGVETVHLATRDIPEHVSELVPFQEAQRLGVLPFEEVGAGSERTLRIAMTDPMDFDAIDALGQWVSVGMEPVLVGPMDLHQTLRKLATPPAAPARPTSQTGSGTIPLARVTIGKMQRPVHEDEGDDLAPEPGGRAAHRRYASASGSFEVAGTEALYEEPASASVAWSARQALSASTSPLSTTPSGFTSGSSASEPTAAPRPLVSQLPEAPSSTPTSGPPGEAPGASTEERPQPAPALTQQPAEEEDLFDFGAHAFNPAEEEELERSPSGERAHGAHVTPYDEEDLLSFGSLSLEEDDPSSTPATRPTQDPHRSDEDTAFALEDDGLSGGDFSHPPETATNVENASLALDSDAFTTTDNESVPVAETQTTPDDDEGAFTIDRGTFDDDAQDDALAFDATAIVVEDDPQDDDEGAFTIDRGTFDDDDAQDDGLSIERASYADDGFADIGDTSPAPFEAKPETDEEDDGEANIELAGFFAEDAGFEAESVRDEPAWSATASVVSSRKARTDAFFEDELPVAVEAQSQAAQPLFERRAAAAPSGDKPRRVIPPPPPSTRRPQTGALPGVGGARVTSAQPGTLLRPSTMVAPALADASSTGQAPSSSIHSAMTAPGSASPATPPVHRAEPQAVDARLEEVEVPSLETTTDPVSSAPPGRSNATSEDVSGDEYFPRVHSFVESGLNTLEPDAEPVKASAPFDAMDAAQDAPLDFDFGSDAGDTAPPPPAAPAAPPRRTGTFRKLDPPGVSAQPEATSDPLEDAIRKAPAEALIALVHQLVEIGMLDRDSLLEALQDR